MMTTATMATMMLNASMMLKAPIVVRTQPSPLPRREARSPPVAA
jgi:hypothetical protein